MKKVVFISVVNERDIYKRCILENEYIKNNEEIETACLDNTVENLFISKRYNEFISGYDFSQDAWLIFCHSDWEIRENIVEHLASLDKNNLYGPIGVIITDNEDGVITREFRGRIYDKKRDGTNERLMEGDLFKDDILVDTFDCQCLIVHSSLIKKHDLKFDENLEFDFYVEDFCISSKINKNIESHILNIDCCHWQQLEDINERPHFFDKADYINNKYPNHLFGAVIIPIGGNSGVKITQMKDIAPTVKKIEDRSKIYHSSMDISNIYDARVIAFNYIDKNAQVLDVGCACGDFGKVLKELKNCNVYGMEYDEKSISEAKKTGGYSEVYQVDLNAFKKEQYSHLENKFDYIVFGDVLEHIMFPQETLNAFKCFLKDDGHFVLSIPNISHASIKGCLLKDEFEYTDTGLLDKTHLKFFTYKSIPPLLGDIQLELADVKFTPFDIFGGLTSDPFVGMPLTVKKYIFSDPHSFVCQYVVKASKSSLGKTRTNMANMAKIDIEKERFPDVILNLMSNNHINATECDLLEQKIKWMETSRFWKLRELHFKIKFAFFSPIKFIKKYINI